MRDMTLPERPARPSVWGVSHRSSTRRVTCLLRVCLAVMTTSTLQAAGPMTETPVDRTRATPRSPRNDHGEPGAGSLTSCLLSYRQSRGRQRTPRPTSCDNGRAAVPKCRRRLVRAASQPLDTPSAARPGRPAEYRSQGERLPPGLFPCLFSHSAGSGRADQGQRTPKARPPRLRATLPERCLQPWIDRFALEREDTKPHSKAARSRPSAARSAGGATRSALIARTPTSQSDSTAHELTRLVWRAFAPCFLDRFTVGKDVASAHEFHSHHGGLGGVIGWSGRLPMSPAPVLTAWRERPPLVAGETAPPVKNGGRSRHGTDIDRLPDVGESTRAAKSAARQQRSASRRASSSCREPLILMECGVRVRPSARAESHERGNTPH